MARIVNGRWFWEADVHGGGGIVNGSGEIVGAVLKIEAVVNGRGFWEADVHREGGIVNGSDEIAGAGIKMVSGVNGRIEKVEDRRDKAGGGGKGRKKRMAPGR